MNTCLMVCLHGILKPLRDEKGQDLAEYALIIALIAIACVVAVGVFGSTLGDLYNRIASELPFGVP